MYIYECILVAVAGKSVLEVPDTGRFRYWLILEHFWYTNIVPLWLFTWSRTDVCKRDMQSTEIAADYWESVAADRVWRMAVDDGVAKSEE